MLIDVANDVYIKDPLVGASGYAWDPRRMGPYHRYRYPHGTLMGYMVGGIWDPMGRGAGDPMGQGRGWVPGQRGPRAWGKGDPRGWIKGTQGQA